MVSMLVLSLLLWAAPTQDQPNCFALTYDSLSSYAHAKDFPSTLSLGGGVGEWRTTAALDTTGRWGTPLAWNTYRQRGDSVVVWVADGNREIRIVGRTSRNGLDGQVEVRTDVPGRELAHVLGQRMQCVAR